MWLTFARRGSRKAGTPTRCFRGKSSCSRRSSPGYQAARLSSERIASAPSAPLGASTLLAESSRNREMAKEGKFQPAGVTILTEKAAGLVSGGLSIKSAESTKILSLSTSDISLVAGADASGLLLPEVFRLVVQ